jgi:putative tryptophan/tyrosine transport system substrate-binding protein
MDWRRREVLLVLSTAVLAPRKVVAKPRNVRIGVLSIRRKSFYLPSFFQRLAELGYVEGKNLVIDFRSVDGVLERFTPLARDLDKAKCDLIVAIGPEQTARALLEAKVTAPGVLLAVNYDPVKAGIVSSLARPGGNITGMFLLQSTLGAKRLELLREFAAQAKSVLVLADPFTKEQLQAMFQAAEGLRLKIVPQEFSRRPYEFRNAFEATRSDRVGGVIPLLSPPLADQLADVAALALEYRLPSVGDNARYTESGFLFHYGVAPEKAFLRAADMVDRILGGTDPGTIPLEQPTQFELGINLKTAKALGVSIPPSIMLRAERVLH